MNIKKEKKPKLKIMSTRIILIGIYEDEEKGILFTRKNDGHIQLPGGKIWRQNNCANGLKQLQAEHNKITRIIFEKCGLSLTVSGVLGYYNIYNPISQKFVLYKVFILTNNSAPAQKNWTRSEQYDAEFIPPDLDLIMQYYPNLPFQDKLILSEYLKNNPLQIEETRPKLVKIIA